MKNRLPLICFTMAAVAFAQGEKKLTYDVVSVKPHAANDFRIMLNMGTNSGGRLNLTGVPLPILIQLAYGSGVMNGPMNPNAGLAGLPAWGSTDRFDIEARPEPGFVPNQDQARQMLRALLEDRFKLKAHLETKDGPVYALVVTKDGIANKKGIKLSENQTPIGPPVGPGATGPGSGAPNSGGPAAGAAPPPPPPPPGPGFNPMKMPLTSMPRGMMMNAPGLLRGTSQTMTGFARLLSGSAGRQVVDKTSLIGLYDIELSYAPTQPMQLPPGAVLPPGVTLPEADPNAPSIFTAVQEQLGLKLESSTAPLESIVVDHIEKPTEN